MAEGPDQAEVLRPMLAISRAHYHSVERVLHVFGWVLGCGPEPWITISSSCGRVFLPPKVRLPREDVFLRQPQYGDRFGGWELQVHGALPCAGEDVIVSVTAGTSTLSRRMAVKTISEPFPAVRKAVRGLGAVLDPNAPRAQLQRLACVLTPSGRRRLIASRAFRDLWSDPRNRAAQVFRREIVSTMVKRKEIEGDISIRLATGDLLTVNPRREKVIARRFLLDGNYEGGLVNVISGLLRPGQIAYDVGACYGHVSMAMARLVGKTGRVIAIEPNPISAEKTRRHLAHNSHPNVTVLQVAIGDQEEDVEFYSFDDNLGGSRVLDSQDADWMAAGRAATESLTVVSLDPDTYARPVLLEGAAAGAIERVRVRSRTLDSVVSETGLVPDFVKIDIEGSELVALRGAARLLEGGFGKRPVFTVEYSSLFPQRRGTREDILELFRAFGYVAHVMEDSKDRGGALRPIGAAGDAPRHDDLVFLPQDFPVQPSERMKHAS